MCIQTEVDVGFMSPQFTVGESDGQINILVGAISGLLQREVAFSFSIADSDALGNQLYYRISRVYKSVCMQLGKTLPYQKSLILL